MPNYSYTTRDNSGKEVRGTMLADNEVDLANKLFNLGNFLVRAKITTTEAVNAGGKIARMKPKELLNFTIQLSALLDAGVPLVAALRDLVRDETQENIKKTVEDICYRVESGSSLKDCLSAHGKSFPKLYTAIVGAGESTGKLSVCLNELARLLEWQMELGAKMKEAATYPIILFCVMIMVVTLLVVKLIPTFEPLFKDMNIALPPPTQAVVDFSNFVRKSWYIIIGIMGLLVVGYKFYYSTVKGRYILDSLKLKIPLAGGLLRKVALARFCHTFALGLKSGVNILTALDFAGEVVGNSRLEQSVKKARDAVNIGEKLGASFSASGEFPPLVVRMITVGEQSGSLFLTLEKVNQFYDREVPATIKKLFAIFEPLMIVIMAVVVGGIAVAIFLPMFKIADAIK